MKAHKTAMIGLTVLAVILLLFGPVFNVGRGFGLFLLICPLMMLGMMSMMGHDKSDHK